MSTEKSPTTLAQEAYAAFGRGDVETIVSMCADDVIWKQIGPDGLATGGTFQGKAAVGQWFANLGTMDDVRQFEPRQFFEGPGHCTAVGSYRAADRKTGIEFSTDWIHLFELKNGKLARWTGALDTDARTRSART